MRKYRRDSVIRTQPNTRKTEGEKNEGDEEEEAGMDESFTTLLVLERVKAGNKKKERKTAGFFHLVPSLSLFLHAQSPSLRAFWPFFRSFLSSFVCLFFCLFGFPLCCLFLFFLCLSILSFFFVVSLFLFSLPFFSTFLFGFVCLFLISISR